MSYDLLAEVEMANYAARPMGAVRSNPARRPRRQGTEMMFRQGDQRDHSIERCQRGTNGLFCVHDFHDDGPCLLVPPGESIDVSRASCDDGYVLHWIVRRGSLMDEGYASFHWTAYMRARRALRRLRRMARAR
jgi:hypothetical protein